MEQTCATAEEAIDITRETVTLSSLDSLKNGKLPAKPLLEMLLKHSNVPHMLETDKEFFDYYFMQIFPKDRCLYPCSYAFLRSTTRRILLEADIVEILNVASHSVAILFHVKSPRKAFGNEQMWIEFRYKDAQLQEYACASATFLTRTRTSLKKRMAIWSSLHPENEISLSLKGFCEGKTQDDKRILMKRHKFLSEIVEKYEKNNEDDVLNHRAQHLLEQLPDYQNTGHILDNVTARALEEGHYDLPISSHCGQFPCVVPTEPIEDPFDKLPPFQENINTFDTLPSFSAVEEPEDPPEASVTDSCASDDPDLTGASDASLLDFFYFEDEQQTHQQEDEKTSSGWNDTGSPTLQQLEEWENVVYKEVSQMEELAVEPIRIQVGHGDRLDDVDFSCKRQRLND